MVFMVKILQSTVRGQITLPKKWRDAFSTKYYKAEVLDGKLVITPLVGDVTFKDGVEESWREYLEGKVTTHEDLKKEYGL